MRDQVLYPLYLSGSDDLCVYDSSQYTGCTAEELKLTAFQIFLDLLRFFTIHYETVGILGIQILVEAVQITLRQLLKCSDRLMKLLPFVWVDLRYYSERKHLFSRVNSPQGFLHRWGEIRVT